MKEKIKKIWENSLKRKLKKFLIIFAVFNLVVYSSAIVMQCRGRVYKPANAFMTASMLTEYMYIFPLSKMIGYKNLLIYPFEWVRDGFYNVGMALFPENEGERELWWHTVRYGHFEFVVHGDMLKYCLFGKKRLPYQVKTYQEWIDELYSHIQTFPEAKITDPVMAKRKLSRYADLVHSYAWTASILYSQLEENKGRKQPIYPDNELADKLINVYNIYQNTKACSKESEPDSFEHAQKNLRFKDLIIKHALLQDIIGSRYNEGKICGCDDPWLKVFAENHKEMRDAYKHNSKEMTASERSKIQMLFSSGVANSWDKNRGLLKDYISCPVLKNYKKYFREEKPNE